jgi:hypothetical protein
MDLVAIEPPAPGISAAGKAPELRDVFFSRRLGGEVFQIAEDQLVKAEPPAVSDLLGSLG